MNYMWWLQEKRPIKANVVNTYIYNNMIKEFKECQPKISMKPYWFHTRNGEVVYYYYNSIPFIPKDCNVTFAPPIPKESGCRIYFDENIPQIKDISGKYGFSLQAEYEPTKVKVRYYILYDDDKLLNKHIQFLLACVATDYEEKMTEDRIAIHKEIKKLANNPGYFPKDSSKSLKKFFTMKHRPLKEYSTVLKQLELKKKQKASAERRSEDGRFLPRKNRN